MSYFNSFSAAFGCYKPANSNNVGILRASNSTSWHKFSASMRLRKLRQHEVCVVCVSVSNCICCWCTWCSWSCLGRPRNGWDLWNFWWNKSHLWLMKSSETSCWKVWESSQLNAVQSMCVYMRVYIHIYTYIYIRILSHFSEHIWGFCCKWWHCFSKFWTRPGQLEGCCNWTRVCVCASKTIELCPNGAQI